MIDPPLSSPAPPDPRPARIVALLSLGSLVSLGLGRFAYALLLPAMRADLNWSLAEAGEINGANAAGYTLGAAVAALTARRLGLSRAFFGSFFLTGVALCASGATGRFPLLLAARFLAGATGAVTFVTGATLAAEAGTGLPRSKQSFLLSLYFAGAGAGIVLSGLVVPLVLEANSVAAGWRLGWRVLGGGTLVCGALAWRGLRGHLASLTRRRTARPGGLTETPASGGGMGALLVAYVLFGAGYLPYMTFIVAFLRAEVGTSPSATAAFWVLLGLSTIGTAAGWGKLFARWPGGRPLAAVLGVATVGAALPALPGLPPLPAAALSALLFGGSFMAAPGAVTAYVRRVLPPAAWTRALGRMTVAFSLGQCLGPAVAGRLADGPGGMRGGLLAAAATLTLGAVVACRQAEPGDVRQARPRAAVNG